MSIATSPSLDFAQSAINQSLTPERKIELFTQMVRIRRFEQTALKYYNAGVMGGFLHLYIGQESVAVGTISLGGPNDLCVDGTGRIYFNRERNGSGKGGSQRLSTAHTA